MTRVSMLATDFLRGVGGLTAALQRSLGRLLTAGRRSAAVRPDARNAEHPAPDYEDAYTLFDAGGLPADLCVERLDEIHAQPRAVHGVFRIRIARSASSPAQAASLVKRRYASRGYHFKTGNTADPDLFTFLAYNSGDLVGTVSVRLDSRRGLAADELYGGELQALRSSGSPLCEFTRLAITASARSKPVLAGLFHTAYLFAHRIRGYKSAVIEVNPRHVLFYERALGFQLIGAERLNPRVNAPAVLLHIHFRTIADGVARYAGKPELAKSTHSLFPYAFSRRDEEGILGRLRAFSDSARECVK